MTALIDRLATDRLRGSRLVLAYGLGIVAGSGLAVAALAATVT